MNNIISLLILILFCSTTSAQALTVTPKEIWSKPHQTHYFTVTGGLTPIFWQSKTGDVRRSKDENVFIYRAPRRYMQDYVRFFDRAGQTIQVNINVLRPLEASPSIRNIPINDKTNFMIIGGSGKWQLEPNDYLNLHKDSSILKVEAGNVAGLHKIQVYDEVTQDLIELEVRVYAPLDLLN
ncbi:hypothetical protein [Candidatus Marithrix sp. Canyon 246]|uniref:hypothetical protein n=1 Tax=Candidatus Marithrix sp. Canyon 246 TaxID=1827136 RepID=UPI00084A229D|nr:hypothetical protein [Candidatus Marithrix sp. Canyon 246]